LLEQVIDDVHHEERIALGSRMDYRCDPVNWPKPRVIPGGVRATNRFALAETLCQINCHVRLAQQRQPKLDTMLVEFEFLLRRAQRMVAGEHLDRPVRPEDQ
jgi:hypothetical protein